MEINIWQVTVKDNQYSKVLIILNVARYKDFFPCPSQEDSLKLCITQLKFSVSSKCPCTTILCMLITGMKHYRTTWVSQYQKGKTSLDLGPKRGKRWWGLGGTDISQTICKQSASCSRQITTSTPHQSIFTGWMLFLTPNRQCQSTEDIHKDRNGAMTYHTCTQWVGSDKTDIKYDQCSQCMYE